MQFKPDLDKQAPEMIFSRKTMKAVHSAVQFSDSLTSKNILVCFEMKNYFKKRVQPVQIK